MLKIKKKTIIVLVITIFFFTTLLLANNYQRHSITLEIDNVRKYLNNQTINKKNFNSEQYKLFENFIKNIKSNDIITVKNLDEPFLVKKGLFSIIFYDSTYNGLLKISSKKNLKFIHYNFNNQNLWIIYNYNNQNINEWINITYKKNYEKIVISINILLLVFFTIIHKCQKKLKKIFF